MACQVSYPAISKRGGSYSLVKVSIYKRVGRSRQSCKLHTLKGVPFLNRRYKIGVPYLLKTVYKKGKGLGLSVYNFSWGSLPSGLQEKKKKEHYLVANRSSRSLDLLRGSGMLSVLTLRRRRTFSQASLRSECTFPRTSARRLAWRNTFPRAFWVIFGWTLTMSGTFHTLNASFSARARVINWLLTTIDIEGLPRNKNKKSNIFIIQTFKLIAIFQQVS